MKRTLYHSLLRVSALVFAILVLFESGILNKSTSALSQSTTQYLANSIGVTVGVNPTELNTMTAKLAQRDQELDAREEALAEREITVNLDEGFAAAQTSNISTYILSTILFILVVLITLNYALDYIRERRRFEEQQLSST